MSPFILGVSSTSGVLHPDRHLCAVRIGPLVEGKRLPN